jgi:hypothetical protein
VGWFSGRGELVAVAGACERDPRLQRLCRRSEDDDVILEMVLQQFGLGACGTDGDGGGGVGVDCSDEGWSVEHLRGILFSAATSRAMPPPAPPAPPRAAPPTARTAAEVMPRTRGL